MQANTEPCDLQTTTTKARSVETSFSPYRKEPATSHEYGCLWWPRHRDFVNCVQGLNSQRSERGETRQIDSLKTRGFRSETVDGATTQHSGRYRLTLMNPLSHTNHTIPFQYQELTTHSLYSSREDGTTVPPQLITSFPYPGLDVSDLLCTNLITQETGRPHH